MQPYSAWRVTEPSKRAWRRSENEDAKPLREFIIEVAEEILEEDVVAENDWKEATFKQCKRYDNTKTLHPLNPQYNDIILNKDKEYRIVGVVMEKKRYK